MPRLRPLDLTLTSMFAALTAAGAYMMFPLPFSPVPVTVQTLFIYLAGIILGGWRGALSQALYLGVGIAGFPVFAGGKAGFGVFLGPTGGYLAGFIVSACLTGFIFQARKKPSEFWAAFSMVMGTLPIYGLGVLQLSAWLKISLLEAVLLGVVPFIPGDAVKILAASLIAVRIRKVFPMIDIIGKKDDKDD